MQNNVLNFFGECKERIIVKARGDHVMDWCLSKIECLKFFIKVFWVSTHSPMDTELKLLRINDYES